ncbi:HD-GYP domain-containing protein [Heliorestis convoluta]|uniref:HD-GYP domain-containing protein n=1 Tax=Heliorestis convoluta TaxID=356322 RepID=A0A5Q2MYS3_9FIRM|nr:HD-GYP domain-containing protein [Heliorestis convoluta]QGG46573.1 HD-GYP domain-containing protein [Heliorestis convoluta]
MYTVNVDSIDKKMVLCENLYSKTGALIMRQGRLLDERIIPYLKRLGVTSVIVKDASGKVNNDPFCEYDIKGLFADSPFSRSEPQRGENNNRYERLRKDPRILLPDHTETNSLLTLKEIDRNNPFDLLREEVLFMIQNAVITFSLEGRKNVELIQKVVALFEELLEGHNEIINLLDIKATDSFTYQHSINVAVISTILASHLDYQPGEIKTVALGALLHDIGKRKTPPHIRLSDKQLSLEDRKTMELHPVLGYDYIIRNPIIPEEAAFIVYQHHERLDGSGYPAQLKGDEIHPFAQLVGMVDVFEAMHANRHYRSERNEPVEIVEYFMSLSNTHFPEKLVRVMLSSISLYPIGSVVQLNNNECGIVIKSNSNIPCRPVIRIIFDRLGFPVRGERIIDLSHSDKLTYTITRSFG